MGAGKQARHWWRRSQETREKETERERERESARTYPAACALPSPFAFWVVVVVAAGAAGSVGCLLSAGFAAAGSAGFVLASVGLVLFVCVCACVGECVSA